MNVSKRDLNEKTRIIRARGFVPANIYSSKLESSIPVEVYKTDFKRFIESNNNKNTISLNLDGETYNCKLTEVQIDGVKGEYLHIDFKLV